MTLVIAKHFPDGVALIGDTRCTPNHDQSVPTSKDWAIKTHILSPKQCVGFAGNTDLARQGIAQLRLRQVTKPESAVEILTQHHRECFDSETIEWPVDFLVASSSRIFEVKRGMCSERVTIGYVGQVAAMEKIESAVTACLLRYCLIHDLDWSDNGFQSLDKGTLGQG